jgi:hypothetical protein
VEQRISPQLFIFLCGAYCAVSFDYVFRPRGLERGGIIPLSAGFWNAEFNQFDQKVACLALKVLTFGI